MMLLGLIVPIYWWRTKKVPVKFFGLGALVWMAAILPKILLDLTISPSINSYLYAYSVEAFVIITGLYIGLRTGLFESGFTYLVAIKTKLKNLSWNQAIGFGLGFGCFEALVMGFLSFINIYAFVAMPELINQLTAEQAEALNTVLNQSTWIVPAAIIERISVIFIHVFSTLLVFYAIRINSKKYLWYSIGFKTIVDGIIPALQVYVGSNTITDAYLIELPFIGLGVLAFAGIIWIKRLWSEKQNA